MKTETILETQHLWKAVRMLLGVLGVLFLMASGSALGVSHAGAQQLVGPTPLPTPPGKPEVIPGQFIVKLKPGVRRDAFINEHHVATFFRYTIINGFAARMSQAAANRLAADARVRSVSPDLVVRAFAPPGACMPWPECKKGDGGGGSDCTVTSGDMPLFHLEAPTGVRRSDADLATTTGAGVKVAVIDTGIDACHPDLKDNYKGGVNLVEKGGKPPKDGHGHGTHVAGTIGARDNLFGVVGVAPRAHLHAVKVLDDNGSGSLSTVIQGLDWAAKNGMQVVNLSLGAWDFYCIFFGLCGVGPECDAVANAVAAGLTVVVAAGNSASEALYFTPANCAYSLTVSAFVDSDGSDKNMGAAIPINGIVEEDDTFAQSFSNYSNYCWDLDEDGLCTAADSLVVNLMAPGVEILSTLPTYPVTLNDSSGANKASNYDVLTGTSMATAHATGAAALYIGTNLSATPADVRVALTTGGSCWGGPGMSDVPAGSITCLVPWPVDLDFAWEPLLYAEGL